MASASTDTRQNMFTAFGAIDKACAPPDFRVLQRSIMSFAHHHAPNATPHSADVCLAIQGDRLLAGPDSTTRVTLPELATVADWREAYTTPLHVGTIEGRPCWVCSVHRAEAAAPNGWQWHETRALLGAFTPGQWHAVSCARQLVWWEKRHRFCGACGTPTVDVIEERARRCPNCAAVFYPAASSAIIVAVARGDELLLAHNKNFRAGMFSLLAGFVDPGETLEQAVVREVREETGVEVGDVRYATSQPWSFPNSLMLGFRARYVAGEIAVDGQEIEAAAWFSREAMPDLPRHGTIARSIIEQWRTEQARI